MSQIDHRSSVRSQTSPTSARSSTSRTPSVKPSNSATPAKKKSSIIPALSTPLPIQPTASDLMKDKKKTIRRNAPPGEDLKCIKKILRTIQGQDMTIQEFVSLIAPSTGDSGAILRTVMNEDLNSFRRLARKVYETITQDNSDVMLNQQLQLSEFYKEKKILLEAKMMSAIDQIYGMASNFNFDRYSAEKEKYLDELFPVPNEVKAEPEELELMKRQAAYHRLQWLHSEGQRLNEENQKLKRRLQQMKQIHMEEQRKMSAMEQAAVEKKRQLEAAEEDKRERLEQLNDSLEETVIAQERNIRRELDKGILDPIPPKSVIMKKKKQTKQKPMTWQEQAVKEMEAKRLERAQQKDLAQASSQRQTSPFHYSPPKQQDCFAGCPGGPSTSSQAEDPWRGYY